MRQITPETKKATCSIGEELNLALPSNPTTGCEWKVSSYSEQVRVQRGDFDRGASNIGGAGVQHFRITAEQSGDAVLEFHYKQPWEEQVEQVVRISIRIQ